MGESVNVLVVPTASGRWGQCVHCYDIYLHIVSSSRGIELQYVEYGLGGGISEEGDEPATTAEQVHTEHGYPLPKDSESRPV